MKRVGLIGFFGWGNFGDELMLRCWSDAFAGSAIARKVNTLLHRPYFEEPADSVARRFEALVIGGGDLVHPDAISPLYWNRSWLQKPIVIEGIGVALERRRERSDVLERLTTFFSSEMVRSIGARDGASAAWLREHLDPARPVGVSADLGFATDLPAPVPPRDDRMGIVLRKVPSEEDRRVVRRLLTWGEAHGVTMELLVLATGAERQREIEGLRSELPRVPFRTADSIEDLMRAISGYRCLFSAKFHGAVVASRYGIPSLSLRPTHKISALACQLGDPELAMHPSEFSDTQLLEVVRRRPPTDSVREAESSAKSAITRAVDTLLAAS